MSKFQIIKRQDIDLNKWDALVERYGQGLPYAYSWYLDAVCENWQIIIYGAYEAGFAFQIKKKFGLPYSLHPFMVQQLGYLGKNENLFRSMLKLIEKKVFHYHYQLNFFNSSIENALLKPNYELILDQPYEKTSSNYKTNTKRNLKKASKANSHVTIDTVLRPTDLEFIARFSKNPIGGSRKQQFEQLMLNASKQSALEIYRSEIENQLGALVVFIKNKKRTVYLLAVNSTKGQEAKLNFILVDQFIKNNANSNMILDFEGSSIKGIARFYAGFGASPNTYQIVKKPHIGHAIRKII